MEREGALGRARGRRRQGERERGNLSPEKDRERDGVGADYFLVEELFAAAIERHFGDSLWNRSSKPLFLHVIRYTKTVTTAD